VLSTQLEKVGEHHNQFAAKLEDDLKEAINNYIKDKQKAKKRVFLSMPLRFGPFFFFFR
jgi:hypothetical protein